MSKKKQQEADVPGAAGETAAAQAQESTVEPVPMEMFGEGGFEQFGVEEKAGAGESAQARLRALVEAVIYVTEEPLTARQMSEAFGQPVEVIQQALAEITAGCAAEDRGLTIREIAGGYKMGTKPEFHDDIRTFVKKLKPPFKLSLAALETLAVIAYKQPITAPEIMEIRGVSGAGVVKTLLDRKLVTAAGRKQVVGKPVLYKTTREFLVQFGLKDIAELPTLKEFEELSRLALGEGEVEEPVFPEPVSAEASAAEPAGPAVPLDN